MRAAQSILDPCAILTPPGSPPPWRELAPPAPVDPRTIRASRVLCMVLVGQSNSANMATGAHYVSTRPPGRVLQLNPDDGALYPYLADPLVGASGPGGHWVLNLADRLILNGVYDYVVIVGIAAIGGASIEYFVPGALGTLHHRLIAAGERLRDLGMRPSCWNFALGESAIGYPEASFRAPLDAMIASVRAAGHNEPWILDITTLNADPATGTPRVNEGARLALQHAVNGYDILAGVDTDDLTYPTYRLLEITDDTPLGAKVHLNGLGCDVKAGRKFFNIAAYAPLLPPPFI